MTSSLKIVDFLEKHFFTNTFLYKSYECIYNFRFIAAVVVKLLQVESGRGPKSPPPPPLTIFWTKMTSSLKIVDILEKNFLTKTTHYKSQEGTESFRFIAAVLNKLLHVESGLTIFWTKMKSSLKIVDFWEKITKTKTKTKNYQNHPL